MKASGSATLGRPFSNRRWPVVLLAVAAASFRLAIARDARA